MVHHALLDGVRLAYDVRGPEGAPPLLLLHALGEDRTDWSEVAPRFAERFRAVAVDLRGHGDSDRPGTYSHQLMADDVLRLLDHLELAQVSVVGHSLGGGVAYLLATQHPGRVARLVVEDVAPPSPRDRPVPERPAREVPFDWAVVPAIIAEVNAGDPVTWERLPSISAPTLVVAGGPESHMPQELLQEVAARVPECSLVTIPAGHHVHRARPGEFAEVVLDWLARTPERGGAS